MPEFSLPSFLTIAALLILVGACATKISTRLNVPVLIIFLAVGMLAGSDGIGKIYFDNASVANVIGTVAMAFILFSGGFDTSWKSVRGVLGYGAVLSTLGVLLTAALVGFFVYGVVGFFFPDKEFPLAWCLLLGAIVSSTDAAAVFAILRSRAVSLKGRLQPLLEFESGSNDPMAAFLTLFLIAQLQTPGASYWEILPQFCLRMGIGLGVGLALGKFATWLFNRIDLEYDGLYYVLGVGFVLLVYGVAEWGYGNGFMAVYAAGLFMGNHRFVFQNGLGRFLDGAAWLMQVLLFVLLGLLVFPSRLGEVLWVTLAIAVFLMFLGRPIAVLLCMLGSRFSWKERTFVSWVGLRGGAPIMLVTFAMLADVPHEWMLLEIVFLIVLASVLVQGMTLMPFAKRLGLDSPLRGQTRTPVQLENTGAKDDATAELEVPEASPLAGKKLVELKLPADALILLIRREGRVIVPRGATQILPKDVLMLIAKPQSLKTFAAALAGEA